MGSSPFPVVIDVTVNPPNPAPFFPDCSRILHDPIYRDCFRNIHDPIRRGCFRNLHNPRYVAIASATSTTLFIAAVPPTSSTQVASIPSDTPSPPDPLFLVFRPSLSQNGTPILLIYMRHQLLISSFEYNLAYFFARFVFEICKRHRIRNFILSTILSLLY